MDRINGITALTPYRQTEQVSVFVAGDRTHRFDNPPFLWCREQDIEKIKGLVGIRYCTFERLQGDNELNHIAWLRSTEAVRAVTKAIPETTAIYDPVERYMVYSNERLYGGEYEPIAMAIDIETFQTTDEFSNAEIEGDEIFIIAMRDTTGWEKIIYQREGYGEKQVIKEMVRSIMHRDPDVICGHNFYNFDLPFIVKRASRYGLTLPLGRDMSGVDLRRGRKSYAERSVEFMRPTIAGRSVIDTLHQAYRWDIYFRELQSYGLKYLARKFNFAERDREYIDGSKLTETWHRDPESVLKYAADDVRETLRLYEYFSAPDIILTRLLPVSQQSVLLMGMATQINRIFLTEYFHKRHSIPIPEEKRGYAGGYTAILQKGVFKDILYADVASLYPSIMLRSKTQPRTDALGLFQSRLRELTEMRFRAKGAMKRTSDADEKSKLNSAQTAYKILINSFYGFLGAGFQNFNDMDQAEFVTAEGRRLVQMLVKVIQKYGGTVIEVDTDGVLFVRPHTVRAPWEENDKMLDTELIERISDDMPEGINIDMDGRYASGMFLKVKNYILRGYNNKLTIKGGSVKNRTLCKMQKDLMRELIKHGLDKDENAMRQAYLRAIHNLENGGFDLEDVVYTGRLSSSVAQYEETIENTNRNRSAPYEIAKKLGITRSGEYVKYYIGGSASVSRIKVFSDAVPYEDGDEDISNVNVLHYIKAIEKVAKRFKDCVGDYDWVFPKQEYRKRQPNPLQNQTTLWKLQ